MLGRKEQVTPQQAQQALGIMDKDFNGRLSKLELFNAFKEVLLKEGYFVNNQNAQQNEYQYYAQNTNNWGMNQQYANMSPNYVQNNQQYPPNFYNHTANMPNMGSSFAYNPYQTQGYGRPQ